MFEYSIRDFFECQKVRARDGRDAGGADEKPRQPPHLPDRTAHIEIRDGRDIVREGCEKAKVVLFSTCGFWEMDSFYPQGMHVEAIRKKVYWQYAYALLRRHSSALHMLRRGMLVRDVLEVGKEAGKELWQAASSATKLLRR